MQGTMTNYTKVVLATLVAPVVVPCIINITELWFGHTPEMVGEQTIHEAISMCNV